MIICDWKSFWQFGLWGFEWPYLMLHIFVWKWNSILLCSYSKPFYVVHKKSKLNRTWSPKIDPNIQNTLKPSTLKVRLTWKYWGLSSYTFTQFHFTKVDTMPWTFLVPSPMSCPNLGHKLKAKVATKSLSFMPMRPKLFDDRFGD
jgi:hypothetical protein